MLQTLSRATIAVLLTNALCMGARADEAVEDWSVHLRSSWNSRSIRWRAESESRLQLLKIERQITLSEGKLIKLRLAAQGDVARFFGEVDAFRAMIDGSEGTFRDVRLLVSRSRALHLRLSLGLHGEGSLLRKTLRSTLNENEIHSLQQALEGDALRELQVIDRWKSEWGEGEWRLLLEEFKLLGESIAAERFPENGNVTREMKD